MTGIPPKDDAPLWAKTEAAQYIAKHIDRLKSTKSQREIAFESGFERPNMISMIKTGQSKVPLDKVTSIAKAIGSDPAVLLRLTLEQHYPDEHHAIRIILSSRPSDSERKLLQILKDLKSAIQAAIDEDASGHTKIAIAAVFEAFGAVFRYLEPI